MKMEKRYFVVCRSTAEDMTPTGFYDIDGHIVSNEKGAALFVELLDCVRFVEWWSIPLGKENYIGFIRS